MIPFRWPGPLVAGTFLRRPNRFLAMVEVEGRQVEVHVADPGRLKELLVPGAPVWLAHSPSPKRKTSYTLVLVSSPEDHDVKVCVDSLMANREAQWALENGVVPSLEGPWVVKREHTHGKSRFDFLLTPTAGGDAQVDRKEVLVEVKSVSLRDRVTNESEGFTPHTALFPDAPTQRGARHIRELAALARSGRRTAVIFCVSRPDADAVSPFQRRDPLFAQAVKEAAQAGVVFQAVRFRYTLEGAIFHGPLPVVLH